MSTQVETQKLFYVVVLSLAVVKLMLSSMFELHFDESYYWYWSKNLQLSYYDHPPMVAWFILAGTSIFGDTEFGVRFLGQIACTLASWCLFDAARRAYGTSAAWFAGLGLQATILAGAGGVLMTPDTPLMLFSTLVLWALFRLCFSHHPAWWIVVGLAGGAAFLSKYTAFLFAFTVGLWIVTTPQIRSWLRQPGPWFAVLIAWTCFSPVLIWNFQNNWISFSKQGGRLFSLADARPELVLEYIGGQIGVITPVLAFLLILGVWKAMAQNRRGPEPLTLLLVLWCLIPSTFFLFLSPFMHVQANWPAPIWPAAILATASLLSSQHCPEWVHRLKGRGLTSGIILVALVWAHACSPFPICLPKDPVAQIHGQRDLVGRVLNEARKRDVGELIAPKYATASMLRFYGNNEYHVRHIAKERRYIGFNETRPKTAVLILSKNERLPPRILQAFGDITDPTVIYRRYHGCNYKKYYLRFARRPGAEP